ncbi:MAG: PfkB family carbohydrate kinase [Bacteroidota bacterium]
MVRKVFTLGETVLDILFRNHEPFTAKAGGSCLNSAVSLGRLGLDVNFISEYGLDEVGNYIDKFLNSNNVDTKHVYRYYDGQSALALAFLNENNDASYDFYKIFPEKRLAIPTPEIKQNDILLFGSFFAITKAVRFQLLSILKAAKKNKAIVIYDPNFRKGHLHELKELKPLIVENMKYADIIRASNEDFSLIFGANNADEAYEAINDKHKALVYTANKNGVFLRTNRHKTTFKVPQIDPISTIGAGDNFNAGIIYSLMKKNTGLKSIEKLQTEEWEFIVNTGIEFATQTCLSYENYLSEEFAREFGKR